MDMSIPALRIKIMLESNPLRSMMLVRRLAVHIMGTGRQAGREVGEAGRQGRQGGREPRRQGGKGPGEAGEPGR